MSRDATGKKILMITSGQPALNPRLVKEADALADAGYNVTVLYTYWNDWGTRFDQILIPSKKWKAIRVGGDPQQKKITYFVSRLIHKTAKLINSKTRGKYLPELAIARPEYFLTREAKKHQADLYIGHNAGALSVTVKAAKANKKPCGFDAEDLHRFELSNDKNDPGVLLKTRLEEKYIPQLNYLTASSQQIGNAYHQLFPSKTPVVILNVFPKDLQVKEPVLNEHGPIRLFWFSQTIGANRGLEYIIEALSSLKNYNFELHLLGQVQNNIFDGQKLNITFHEPIQSDRVTLFASQFDIGLALENNIPLNRDICLTNKIFTYLQAGLGIIASDTEAQSSFINTYPAIGKVYKRGDISSLSEVLLYYHTNREKLLETRQAALNLAREKLNWEQEQKKFLAQVKKTLDQH